MFKFLIAVLNWVCSAGIFFFCGEAPAGDGSGQSFEQKLVGRERAAVHVAGLEAEQQLCPTGMRAVMG